MRYTEARLTPIARLLLAEIAEGTVDFMPNYDGSTQEPRLLPARLPFVLLNGASGIAVGMATEIPSHNLREVAAATLLLLGSPKASLDDLLGEAAGTGLPGRRPDHLVAQRYPRHLRDRPRQPEGARALRLSRSSRAASGSWSSPSFRHRRRRSACWRRSRS